MFSLGKFGWTEMICVKKMTFCNSAPVSGDLSRNLVPLLCDSRQYPGILLSNQIGSISASKTSYFCVFMCFKQNFEPISLKQYKFLFHCYATVVNIQHCQFYKKMLQFSSQNQLPCFENVNLIVWNSAMSVVN